MKLKKESSDFAQCFVLWQLRVQDDFNTLRVDRVLNPSGLSLILGGVDGIIRVFDVDDISTSDKPKASVDTKGGPIQCLATHNVTRLGQVDMLAADAYGTLIVVCGQQILSRQSLASHAVTCLLVQEDGRGYIEIVSSSERGLITACQSSCQLWTINLNDFVKVSRRSFVMVKCLLSVELPDCHGHNLQYLLAADDTHHLHLILQGQIITSFTTPAIVTAMAQGMFIPPSQLDISGNPMPAGSNCKQVALGTATGAIYIFHNMAISAEEIARAESPITHLAALSVADSPLDLLLCAGHFKALSVYRQGKVNEDHHQIIPYHRFHVPDLKDIVNIRNDYISWIQRTHQGTSSNRQGIHFCSYPFMFDAGTKSILLQTDAQLQMRNAMEEVTRRNLMGMFMPIDPVSSVLVMMVTRQNIVKDTITTLQKIRPQDLKKPLKVVFLGEEAVDEGGVRKEFFMLLLREVLDPKYGMFLYNEDSHLIWFNAQTFEGSEMFHLIGILCGLAIYNFTIIDLSFPLALYRKLLQRPITLEDLRELMPTVGRSLQELLDYEGEDVEDVFCLNFTINQEVFGEVKVVDLCADGASKVVTHENKEEYVDMYVDFILNRSVDSQFRAFSEGFLRVCGGQVLELFHPQELQAMVIGNEDYDFRQLEKNTEYKGEYYRYHETIKFFWDVFHGFSVENKKKFLLFLTGSDRVPVLGMSHIKMIIQPTGGGEDFLPVAHTCFNLLDLPKYRTRQAVEEKLLLAIQHTEGFGIV